MTEYSLASAAHIRDLQGLFSEIDNLINPLIIFSITQAKNRPNGQGTISWTSYVQIDLYDRRIRFGPGYKVQIGVLQQGDTRIAVCIEKICLNSV